jgi:uncharacterized protein YndB with AHSA1/START domain
MTASNPITVTTVVKAPLDKVWDKWNKPEHITKWAFASDDWEAPSAENDARTGGKFRTRMQSKDGSQGFEFTGIYTNVNGHELIEYNMDDGRHVKVKFEETPAGVKVTETFDPEHENEEEVQRSGWQSILDNFKKYVEHDKS